MKPIFILSKTGIKWPKNMEERLYAKLKNIEQLTIKDFPNESLELCFSRKDLKNTMVNLAEEFSKDYPNIMFIGKFLISIQQQVEIIYNMMEESDE